MKKYLFLIVTTILLVSSVSAEPLSTADYGSIQAVLFAHQGKLVTIKLRSGNELTGVVDKISGEIVYLSELTGMEYYDAATSIESIEAVVIRTKE